MFTLVLLGPPGAGKGTQAVRICERFNLEHISTGDMLREEIESKSQIGLEVEGYLKRGELVPNERIIDMVGKKMSTLKSHGIILDGFPRTIDQAKALDELVAIDMAINIAVPSEVLLERICNRRTCPNCKATFSADQVDGKCTRCGHELYIREDDKPDTFKNRLNVYEERTAPIIEYYRKKDVLVEVDGGRLPDAVYEEIVEKLEGKADDKH